MHVIDIEANGFLDVVTQMWCAVATEVYTGETYEFGPGELNNFTTFLDQCPIFVGHNILPYDIPVIQKCLNYEYRGRCIDTLVMSRTLDPDRKLPENCPTHIYNPISGKKEMVGPHSLAAWGYRVGRGKPSHFEWDHYSPEMLHRCKEDVEINRLTLLSLAHEAGIEPQDLASIAI